MSRVPLPGASMASADPTHAGLVVLAVDDEAPALDELTYLLGQDHRISLVCSANDATGAFRLLQDPTRPTPDLVVLDIRMPGLDGIELARVLAGLRYPPTVVFVSAHDDRAIDAYDIGAVDYVLKPVRAERLSAAITRVLALRRPVVTNNPDESDEMIAVELAGTTKLVARSTICFAEAQGDYARLHVEDGRSHLLRTPLSVLQERWEHAGFIRVHRSFLVPISRITELRNTSSGQQIKVTGQPAPVELPVSRRHVRELKDRLFGAAGGAGHGR